MRYPILLDDEIIGPIIILGTLVNSEFYIIVVSHSLRWKDTLSCAIYRTPNQLCKIFGVGAQCLE